MPNQLARQIKSRRTALDMTIETMAKRSGIKPGMLRQIEAGTNDPIPTHILDMAIALQCHASDLLCVTDHDLKLRLDDLEERRRASKDVKERAEYLLSMAQDINPIIKAMTRKGKIPTRESANNTESEAEKPAPLNECLSLLTRLNSDGMQEAIRQIRLLTEIPRFTE